MQLGQLNMDKKALSDGHNHLVYCW